MMKEARKRQIVLILILSVLVLVCLIVEAGREEVKDHKTKIVQKEKEEQHEGEKKKEKRKKKKVEEETNVRVLLMTSRFASLFHRTVKVTSSKPFTVEVNGKAKQYDAGDSVEYSAGNSRLKKKKIVITPAEGAKLKVLSVTRQNIHPSYRRTLQVTWNKKGLLLMNKLPLEEYLYAVVPSELSTSSKMDALKAQAVCARSYAYQQMQSARYDKYHADLDDSVACQVYNNIPEDSRSRKAVNSTKGMVLTNKKGAVIQVYYYSTSLGYSASGQDVWNTPSKVSYLKECFQITEKSRKKSGVQSLNLSQEQNFENFINSSYYDTYDSDSAWYRWSVVISQKSLSERIDAAIASCYASDPTLVLTQKKNGGYARKPLKPLGALKKIRVEKRENSGLVTELVLVGKKNVIKICTQYNIRKVLAPVYEQVSYNDGKSKTSMSLLPSAAFYVANAVKDDEAAFEFVGGGFGHGAGMSQCGAEKMAKLGKNYQEILLHYFAGTKIMSLKKVKKADARQ